jgi:hypothetical protein
MSTTIMTLTATPDLRDMSGIALRAATARVSLVQTAAFVAAKQPHPPRGVPR